MAKVAYKDIKSFYQKCKQELGDANGRFSNALFLIFGEEALYKEVLEKLKELLLPTASDALNFEPLEGTDDNFPEIIERANTFSLLSGPKVVVAMDAQVFETKQNVSQLWQDARKAFDDQKLRGAARVILRIMGLMGLSMADVSGENRYRALGLQDGEGDDHRWLDDILAYCAGQKLSVPRASDSAGLLQRVVEKGIPDGNYIVVTTATVDKRRSLYKAFLKNGMVIDCSVPKSDRRADRQVQTALLQEKLNTALAESNKTMGSDAFEALVNLIGFDLRAFDTNLKKLITFVGDRNRITQKDVNDTLIRTRQDPIYAFTNAVSDRSLKEALFYLNTLMADGPGAMRPEQMLVAIHNQIRKLLVLKDFMKSTLGNSWYSGCPYNLFQQNVLPLIKEYDRMLLTRLEKWQILIGESRSDETANKKKSTITSDLLLASRGGSPYPVYLMLKKAERFSYRHLMECIGYLSQADRQIKSGSTDKKLILENLLIRICLPSQPSSDEDASMSTLVRSPQARWRQKLFHRDTSSYD